MSKHFHFTTSKHLLFLKDKENDPASGKGGGQGGSRPSPDLGRTPHSPQQEEQTFTLPVLPNGPPTLGTDRSTPLAVIRFGEDPPVNVLSQCFVGSTETGHLSNGPVS